MTNHEWQDTFSKNLFADKDPIRLASFNLKTRFFAFSDITVNSSISKEIMRQRRLHQIENGMIIMERHNSHNFIMTLATGYKNFDAHKYYLDNHQPINIVFNDLKEMLIPSVNIHVPANTLN